MKLTKIKQGLVILTIASGAFAVGCELIVDFDRTKIPVEVSEASIPEGGGLPDGSDEGGNLEAGADEAGDADATTVEEAGGDADAGSADATAE